MSNLEDKKWAAYLIVGILFLVAGIYTVTITFFPSGILRWVGVALIVYAFHLYAKKHSEKEDVMGMQARLSDVSQYAFPALRIGLGLMLLLAGLHALFINPGLWQSYVAPWFLSIWPFSIELFMAINARVEIVLGLALIFGVYTTSAALVSSLVLAGITVNVATAGIPADIVIRDIGLVFLAVGVTLASADRG